MDENLWAANSNAHERSLVELWREQHVCRTDHVYLFRSLSQADTEKSGKANGAAVSVRALPWLIAGPLIAAIVLTIDKADAALPWLEWMIKR